MPDAEEFENLKLSRDGRILAATHTDGKVSVWDTSTGKCVQKFTHPPSEDSMGGYFRIPATFAVSSNGHWIASGEGGTFESFVWEARTRKVLWKWTTTWRDAKPADFNPAGDTLAAMGEDRLDFLDAATGEKKQSVQFDYKEVVDRVCYSPDGQHLLAARDDEINDKERSVIVLFTADSGDVVWKIETAFTDIYSIAYSPDGATIAVTGELPRVEGNTKNRRAVQIRNATDGTIRFAFEASDMPFLANTVFSPNGKLLATGDQIWELPTE